MVQPYEVSELWLSSKGIVTPTEQQRLPDDVKDSLLHFMLKKVEAEIEESRLKLKAASDPDEISALVARHSALVKKKQSIGKDLRMVISGM